MRLHIAPTRFVVVVALIAVCGFVAAGCGAATEPAMPHLGVSATVGPKPHGATVSIAVSGVGTAMAAIVITYPDGHREQTGSGQWQAADSGSFTTSNLPKGNYEYTVHAISAKAQNAPPLSVGYFVDRYAVASGAFTIH
jgi:hypothetical protein